MKILLVLTFLYQQPNVELPMPTLEACKVAVQKAEGQGIKAYCAVQ